MNLCRVIYGMLFIALCAGFAVAVLSLGGCNRNKRATENFARAASTGLALIQQAAADAQFEVIALDKEERHPLKKARLASISRSHGTIQNAAVQADASVATSRKQYWELKGVHEQFRTGSKAELDKLRSETTWLGWKTWRYIRWIIGIWFGIGIASMLMGVFGLVGISSSLMRMLPFSNVFAFARDRIIAARRDPNAPGAVTINVQQPPPVVSVDSPGDSSVTVTSDPT